MIMAVSIRTWSCTQCFHSMKRFHTCKQRLIKHKLEYNWVSYFIWKWLHVYSFFNGKREIYKFFRDIMSIVIRTYCRLPITQEPIKMLQFADGPCHINNKNYLYVVVIWKLIVSCRQKMKMREGKRLKVFL